MAWQIEGEYIETCNCSFVCPCITSNLSARPTEGDCKAAVAMRIDRGAKDGVDLSGLSFVVLLHSPGVMADGNFKVGLIVDEAADEVQTEAIQAIASGAAGGPMAALAPLVGRVRRRREAADPLRDRRDDALRERRGLLDQAVRGRAERFAGRRADLSREHRPPGFAPACAGESDAEPDARLRHRLGRRQRHAQRPFRPVLPGAADLPRRPRRPMPRSAATASSFSPSLTGIAGRGAGWLSPARRGAHGRDGGHAGHGAGATHVVALARSP